MPWNRFGGVQALHSPSSARIWRAIAFLSLIVFFTLATGFVYAVKTVVMPAHVETSKPEEIETEQTDIIKAPGVTIVTLGDFLTKGTGDVSGRGYAGMVREWLSEQLDEPVYFIPFAVNGYRTDQLLQAIREQQGLVAALKQADLILMTIGGNDLFTFGEEVTVEKARQNMPATLNRLDAIFAELARINPRARILYLALYNPFIRLDPSGEASLFVQQFNYEVFRLSVPYNTITVVPTFDLFEPDPAPFLASDRFHPNEAGYARIAQRVTSLLLPPGGDESPF